MNTTETARLIENIIRIGTVAVIDHSSRKLKVRSGDLLTNWLDWPAEIGRNYTRWRPLRLETQVIITCPAGDPAQALIIGMLYSISQASPNTDPDIDLIAFDNGSFIEHNHRAKTLKLHSAGDFSITAAGNMNIIADGNSVIQATRVDIN